MKFTDLFIKRPVLSFVISAMILLIGIKSIYALQVRQYPLLTNTVITVTTTYPGASADLMQGFITSPIQEAVASAEGVEYITSSSNQGISLIKAHIRLNFPPNEAMTEVMAKTQQVNSVLPKGVNTPVITKATGSGIKILYASFSSNIMSNPQITDYLKRQLQPNLATIDGVASVEIFGGQTFAMRIWLSPEKMAAKGISSTDITQAIAANNYQSTAGQSKGYFIVSNISANTDISNVEQFGNIVIKSDNNNIIRLSDVAEIKLDSQSYDNIVKMNGKGSVFIAVDNTPTSNPLTVVKLVKERLEELKSNMPPTLEMAIAYDSTEFIKSSIDEVKKTLLEASVIVIIVIFLFLGNIRSVLIPVITIPLSIIGVASLMLIMGFSINLLTLLALVLAIGLVVDDAIVVVENVYRHLSEGKTPYDAAIIGAREIMGPVISMTITLVAVYAPIGFMGGLTGTLFSEFALTLAGAVVISGIIALTLSPMMCSKFLTNESHGEYSHKVDIFFNKIKKIYYNLLSHALTTPRKIYVVFTIIIVTTVVFINMIPKELAPSEDQGIIMMMGKAPQYANIDYTSFYTDQLIDKLMPIKDKDLMFSIAGMGSTASSFAGLLLKPWSKRQNDSHSILANLQPDLATITGMSVFAFEMPPLPSGTEGMPFQMVVTTMKDYPTLYKTMEDLKAAARKTGMFFVVDSDLAFNTPSINIDINHDKANLMGFSMQALGNSLATQLGGNYINMFNLEGKGYQVIPMVPRAERLGRKAIEELYIYTNDNKAIQLKTIADITTSQQANSLSQYNQINSATLQAVPAPWSKMSDVIKFFKDYSKENFSGDYNYDYLGEARQYITEGNSLYYTFIFALITIYLVLAAQFESLRDPFIIMLSVPMSIFGAMLVLFLGAASLNIYTQIGMVTLIGLITKHGILIVEFANQLQKQQQFSPREAVLEAATTRLRPILMTTAAMVVGLFPLLLATGAGAASRFSIAVVIISGMLIGTIFTIFVVPSFYILISKPYSGNTQLTES
jgi:multidrug efflux pump